MTTTDQLAAAEALYAAATADIPGTLPDEEVDRLVHERTVAERTFMMQAAPALLAEAKQLRAEVEQLRSIPADWHAQRRRADALEADLEQSRRGGKELGKTVVFLGELIKDAYVRGADDPIDALQMLGNVLAEISEDEDGLSAEEFNRVHQALEDRRAAEERLKAQRDAAERDELAAAVRRATTT